MIVSLEKDAIKTAARGRWGEVFSAVAGFEAPDKNGSPCPACGGRDRFYKHSDFDSSGGVGCRRCFDSSNGDGFAAIQHFTGWDFPTVVARVADYLGVSQYPPAKKRKGRRRRSTVADVALDTWSTDLAGYWCLKNPGITEQGLLSAGAQAIRFDGEGLLGFGGKDEAGEVVSWVMLSWTGDALPAGTASKRRWVKTKLAPESKPGSVIGSLDGSVVWRVEGPKDLASLLSVGLPEGHSAFTGTHGASENPRAWILSRLIGKRVMLVFDRDAAGEDGARKWSTALASVGIEHKIVELPFPPDSKKDLRDFFAEGKTFADLWALAEASPLVQLAPPESRVAPEEISVLADDDPNRLAEASLAHYRKRGERLLLWGEQWFVWCGGRYVRKTEKRIKREVWGLLLEEFVRLFKADQEARKEVDHARKVSTGQRENTFAAIEHLCMARENLELNSWIEGEKHRNYVSLRNGLFDLERFTSLDLSVATRDDVEACLERHSSDWFSTVQLPVAFDLNARCPKWLAFLNRALEGDTSKIETLQEWAGLLLSSDTSYQRFLGIEGGGANGKSVYIAGLTALLGRENVSTMPLDAFGEKFSLASTLGKLANLTDEAPENLRICEAKLKSFVAGSRLTFEEKNQQPFTAEPTARLMFACNSRPKFLDASNGIWRRLLWVEFGRPITASERIVGMDRPEYWVREGEIDGMFTWALLGLRSLRKRGDFRITDAMLKAIEGYRREADPIRQFFDDWLTFTGDTDDRVVCSDLRERYVDWCAKEGYPTLDSGQFGKRLLSAFPQALHTRRRVNREPVYVYQGIRWLEGQ